MPPAHYIWKIVVTGSASTAVNPTSYAYFYKATTTFTTSSAFSIPASNFVNGNGSAVTSLQKAALNNGYCQLYINAQKQESALYTMTSSHLTIHATSPVQTIPRSSPFTFLAVNFAPSTSVTLHS